MQTNDVTTRDRVPVQEGGAFQATDPIVDDATYDLLQALTSKLEAIEAYEQYVLDGNELLDDERRHATRLVGALRERLTGS
jgi:hypothetical protein